MSKQDRQGVRTTQGLEQKYNFGNVFSRLDSENKEQNLTMRQFTEIMVETITAIQKDIRSLTEKDTKIEKSIKQSETALNERIAAYWNTIYPVGSIYVSVSATSPATLFGGTWTQIKDRFLLASGSSYAAGATGGEANHTLTIEEMPGHTHQVSVGETGSQYIYYGNERGAATKDGWGLSPSASQPSGTSSVWARSKGGSKAHNNMPPYLAVYVWKRTA